MQLEYLPAQGSVLVKALRVAIDAIFEESASGATKSVCMYQIEVLNGFYKQLTGEDHPTYLYVQKFKGVRTK
jgi:hypothetical protein